MTSRIDLSPYGIHVENIRRNLAPAVLNEHGVLFDQSQLTACGALATDSGDKKGRSPKDKRIVEHPSSRDDVWWGKVNIPLSEESFAKNRERAIKYLNSCDRLYVMDGFAGWDKQHQIKVRVICSRPYHALFMNNMLIRPNRQELDQFGEPDYVIYNAGKAEADPSVEGVDTKTSVALNFGTGEFVILGSQYAGEMKKGVFTIMHYLMPKRDVLSMHCSASGHRISIKHTRSIIRAIHNGALGEAETITDPIFGLEIPTSVPHVPREILIPRNTWADIDRFEATAAKLAGLFNDNFEKFADGASESVRNAGPLLEAVGS